MSDDRDEVDDLDDESKGGMTDAYRKEQAGCDDPQPCSRCDDPLCSFHPVNDDW